MRYPFYVHRTIPGWRLVIRADTGMPAETSSDQWEFTRRRTGEDTDTDVRRRSTSAAGRCSRSAATFADVARRRSV